MICKEKIYTLDQHLKLVKGVISKETRSTITQSIQHKTIACMCTMNWYGICHDVFFQTRHHKSVRPTKPSHNAHDPKNCRMRRFPLYNVCGWERWNFVLSIQKHYIENICIFEFVYIHHLVTHKYTSVHSFGIWSLSGTKDVIAHITYHTWVEKGTNELDPKYERNFLERYNWIEKLMYIAWKMSRLERRYVFIITVTFAYNICVKD